MTLHHMATLICRNYFLLSAFGVPPPPPPLLAERDQPHRNPDQQRNNPQPRLNLGEGADEESQNWRGHAYHSPDPAFPLAIHVQLVVTLLPAAINAALSAAPGPVGAALVPPFNTMLASVKPEATQRPKM
jgi:hypothetical protein